MGAYNESEGLVLPYLTLMGCSTGIGSAMLQGGQYAYTGRP